MAKFAFLWQKGTINRKNVIENPLQHSTSKVIASDQIENDPLSAKTTHSAQEAHCAILKLSLSGRK